MRYVVHDCSHSFRETRASTFVAASLNSQVIMKPEYSKLKRPLARSSRLLILVAILVSHPVSAGPFGLNMGDSIETLQTLGLEATSRPDVFRLKTVPNPHSKFGHYTAFATKEGGLCKIVAIAGPISTSVYGSELKSDFESLKDALNEKYGKGKGYDFLRAGSIWNEPKDWMMGLLKKERILTTYWANLEFPDHIHAIALEADALRSDTGTVKLSYEFENFKECRDRSKAKENESL